MKLAQFKTKSSDGPRLGLLAGDVIVDISEIAPTVNEFINRGAAAIHAAKNVGAKTAYAPEAVEYLPAVTPGKVIAIQGAEDARKVAGVAELVVTARPGDIIPPAGDKRPSGAMVLATGASRELALKAANDALALIRIETA